jgi:hypothetical protein
MEVCTSARLELLDSSYRERANIELDYERCERT